MNKYNTKLGQLLSFVERPRFKKIVDDIEADKYCKGFSAWQQFVIMVYAQLAHPTGLRSLADSLNASGSLYHLGIHKDVKRSTISYANNNRRFEVFEKLFYSELSTLHVNVAYITKMYSPKWNIEIFFKTIKQNPRIKKFYGQMENAVKTQIWITLIVYLLFLKLPELCTYEGKNFTYFMLGIKVCLFERTDLFSWFVGYPSVRESSFCIAMQPELDL